MVLFSATEDAHDGPVDRNDEAVVQRAGDRPFTPLECAEELLVGWHGGPFAARTLPSRQCLKSGALDRRGHHEGWYPHASRSRHGGGRARRNLGQGSAKRTPS